MSLQLKLKPKLKPAPLNQGALLDIAIIGGGPAGLTAAIYALRAKQKIVLIEKMILGGMASTTFLIENYPGFPEGLSGMELSNRLQDQVKKLGLDICWGQAININKLNPYFEIEVDTKKFIAKTVIIATGTESAKLGIPGENEFLGRGVSYCATCDGAFYKDKQIIVIGGGNAALEEALFLTRYASKVSIVHRRDQLRADKILAERAKANPKIYFFWNSVIEKIYGENKVTGVNLKDMHTNKLLNLNIDGVFIYAGKRANSEIVKDMVKLNKDSFIITNTDLKSSLDGLYAAGDVREKGLRQIVTAVADGAIAAVNCIKYIENSK